MDESRALRGPRLTVAYVTTCPACGDYLSVANFLEPHESSATFTDENVACGGECGAVFDMEWEAIRTMGVRAFASHLISIVQKTCCDPL